MNRRTLLTAVAALVTALALGNTAIAAPGGGHDKRMERMLDAVDATATQRAEIDAAMNDLRPRKQALRQQLRDAHRALHEADPTSPGYAALADEQAQVIGQLTADKIRLKSESRSRIAAILTPEQRATLAELRTKKMEKHKARARHFSQRHDG